MTDKRRPKRSRRLGVLAIFLAWALVFPGTLRSGPPGDNARPENLISAEELKAMLERKDLHLSIIDFRHQAKYYLGHIPGAVQVWRREIPPGTPPPQERLEKLLGRLGVGSKHTIVIYSDQCDHAHLWWLLAYYGFPLDRLKLLDGGFEAWKRKAYPTQLTPPRPKPATFKFPAEPRKGLLATREQVEAAMASPGAAILDVRTREQYLGKTTKEGAARRGRIPGAVWVYWQAARFQEGPDQGCWKSAGDIRRLYAGRGLTPDRDLYIYGHTNLCAAYTLVSLYLAGYPLDKLHVYAGSWIEWSRGREPVETGAEDDP